MVACYLHDMKGNGRFFTWNNKQKGSNRVFGKIDRALCDILWDDNYPTAEVTFLPEGNLGHSPILIRFFSQQASKKCFRFLNFWTNNSSFMDVVCKVWETEVTGCKSFQI